MASHSVTCHPAEVTFPPLPDQRFYDDINVFLIKKTFSTLKNFLQRFYTHARK